MFGIVRYKVVRRRRKQRASKASRGAYLLHKETARALVHTRLRYYNQFYHFPIKRVSIKNHRARWGSCSQLGNINFNYKIIHLEPEVADYVIVHELCHLKELNHSKSFWDLVSRTIPNWKHLRKKLYAVGL